MSNSILTSTRFRSVEEPLTIEDAFEEGNLNWEVGLDDVYDRPNESALAIEGYKQVYRMDTGLALSIVGPTYTPIQNSMLKEWAIDLLGTDKACVTGAGCLKNGRIVYVDFVMDSYVIEGTEGDLIENHLLVINSFDGSRKLTFIPLPGRAFWCENQLNKLCTDPYNEKLFRVSHTASGPERLKTLTKILEAAGEEFLHARQAFNLMAATPAPETQAAMQRLIRECLEVSPEQIEAYESGDQTRQPSWKVQETQIEQLYVLGPGAREKGVYGTMWGFFNAVNTFLNHHRTIREEELKPDAREESNLLGESKRLKERAFAVCYEHCVFGTISKKKSF